MIKQNVNIINFNSLYEILDEIKENLSFNVIKSESDIDFLEKDKGNLKNSLIIINSNKKFFNEKNILIFNNLPISLVKLVELININLIKLKFDSQSKINIKGYELNLNSKFFSKNNINLKVTEKEIEIILYLALKKDKYNVLNLQKNIWGYSSDLETHTVETHIYRLRKKINDKFNDKNFIMSHNDGYFIE
jgi:hypothetical protein